MLGFFRIRSKEKTKLVISCDKEENPNQTNKQKTVPRKERKASTNSENLTQRRVRYQRKGIQIQHNIPFCVCIGPLI